MRSVVNYEQPVTTIIGAGAGDEGKGKIIDCVISEQLETGAEVISVRANGGGNAGHTLEIDDEVYDFHQIPSGVAHKGVKGVIANGYVDPIKTVREIQTLEEKGLDVRKQLLIGSIVHFVMPHHILRDEQRESSGKPQGSTGSGMAYVASDKRKREGLQVRSVLEDYQGTMKRVYEGLREHGLPDTSRGNGREAKIKAKSRTMRWMLAAMELGEYVGDAAGYLNDEMDRGKLIDIEGAQAFLLDVDHGKYPYTTSDNTMSAGLLAGAGIPVRALGKNIGVYKILPSKVGGGPFPTREHDPKKVAKIAGNRGDVDGEYGVTTGREREVGYPDLPSLRRFVMLEQPSSFAFTKVDNLARLNGKLPVGFAYLLGNKYMTRAPSSASELEACEAIMLTAKIPQGKKIRGVRRFSEMPSEYRGLIRGFERQLDTPIEYIGTGPGRHDIIRR